MKKLDILDELSIDFSDEERAYESLKEIELNIKESIMDISLLTLPFAAEYKKFKKIKDENDKYIKNEDGTYKTEPYLITSLVVENEQGHTITVKGDDIHGVPTVYEREVLAALIRLFIKQLSLDNNKTTNKKVFIAVNKNPEDIKAKDRTIRAISIKDIAKEMGYKGNISVTTLAKISDSIKCIHGATYILSNDRGEVKDGNFYLLKAERGIHLLENYELVELSAHELEKNKKKSVAKKAKDDKSVVQYAKAKAKAFDGKVKLVLNPDIYLSIAHEHKLIYNVSKLLKSEKYIDRSIYSLLLKWAGKNKMVTVKDERFFDYIYFDKNISKKEKKRVITNAIKRIHENELCKITEIKKGIRVYDFTNKKIEDKVAAVPEKYNNNYLTTMYNSNIELKNGYLNLGVEDDYISNKILSSTEKDLERLKALCRYAMMLKIYKKPYKNLLNKYLESEDKIDEKYYNK